MRHVEQDEGRRRGQRLAQGLLGVAEAVDVVALARQRAGHGRAHRGVVVDEHHAWTVHVAISDATGSRTRTSDPRSSSLQSEMLPPIASTSSRDRVRPSPRPPARSAWAPRPRYDMSNARCALLGAHAHARVADHHVRVRGVRPRARMRTVPPAGVYWSALSSTLRNTRCRATGSARTSTRARSADISMRDLLAVRLAVAAGQLAQDLHEVHRVFGHGEPPLARRRARPRAAS